LITISKCARIQAMNEQDRKKWASRIEDAGVTAMVIGLTTTAISGILFIASEQNLSPEEMQHLSTNVNGFFQVAQDSVFVVGAGVAAAVIGDKLKK
jgi:hypothetical protein